MTRAWLLFGCGFALLAATGPNLAADAARAPAGHKKHHGHALHRIAAPAAAPPKTLIPRPAPAPGAAPEPASHTETLIVHGQKRFQAAPMPNMEIHDPADALRDPSTGAPIGKFGGAYIDANPVPPINPGLKGDQSPVTEGIQR